MKMGISKNLMIELYPIAEEEDDFDDFFRNKQADESGIHQPAVVKSHNLEPF